MDDTGAVIILNWHECFGARFRTEELNNTKQMISRPRRFNLKCLEEQLAYTGWPRKNRTTLIGN